MKNNKEDMYQARIETDKKYENIIDSLGIKNLSETFINFNYNSSFVSKENKEILMNEMIGIKDNEKKFFVHYQRNKINMTLICCTGSNITFYTMPSNSITVFNKDFEEVASLNNIELETKKFNYRFSDNSTQYKLNGVENSTRMILRKDKESLTFHRPDKSSGTNMILFTEFGYRVNFTGAPYGVINLDNDLNIIDININSKIRSQLGLKKEGFSFYSVDSFHTYYKELSDLVLLRTDEDLPLAKKEHVHAHLEFVRSVINLKNEIIKKDIEVSELLLEKSVYKIKNNFPREHMYNNLKKYNIDYGDQIDNNANFSLSVRNYRNIINMFFEIIDNKIDFIMPKNIKDIENMSNSVALLTDKLYNEKNILIKNTSKKIKELLNEIKK